MEQGLAKSEERQLSPVEKIRNYMLSETVKERFADMMGTRAIYYLNQVMIVVANSPQLQKCSPQSILISAMRAASLRLSVDPGQGQAWIIPYKGEATFQVGYRGIYELAQRTNLYRDINIFPVYEGQEIIEDQITGRTRIEGHRTGPVITAYGLYFKLTNGFEKVFIMTVEEIEEHAQRYSQSYDNPRSPWNDPVERPKMMKKTVLSNGLRKWGRFCDGDMEALNEVEESAPWMGALPDPDLVPVPPTLSEAEIMASIGADASAPDGSKHEKADPTQAPATAADFEKARQLMDVSKKDADKILEEAAGNYDEAIYRLSNPNPKGK